MSSNYIGIFDSGLGGLTAVKELMHLLPNEPIVYFGDTGRVPYGSKSNDTIIKYTKSDIRFLNTFDLKLIVIACGTASAIALRSVEEWLMFRFSAWLARRQSGGRSHGK